MRLGRVIGKVWAERKVEQLHACRLHVVQPITSNLKKAGKMLVVADPQNIAGEGDIIVYVTNTDAIHAFDSAFAPVNACVVQLVDYID